MPKKNKLLLKLEGFKNATPLKLNMGKYNIQINENIRNLFTIISPWDKYLC